MSGDTAFVSSVCLLCLHVFNLFVCVSLYSVHACLMFVYISIYIYIYIYNCLHDEFKTLQTRCSFDDRLPTVLSLSEALSDTFFAVVFSVDSLFRDLVVFQCLALQPFAACYCFFVLLVRLALCWRLVRGQFGALLLFQLSFVRGTFCGMPLSNTQPGMSHTRGSLRIWCISSIFPCLSQFSISSWSNSSRSIESVVS